MRHVTIYTTNKEYDHFLKLAKNLHYVKKIKTDEVPIDIDSDDGDSKEEIIKKLKTGFRNMQLIKQGKLKTTPFKDFLDEL